MAKPQRIFLVRHGDECLNEPWEGDMPYDPFVINKIKTK